MRRRAGPISFVERQIAHVWAASMACSSLLFAIEWILDLPPLYLAPVLGLIAGAVFFAKAGMLSGALYIPAVALFAVSPPDGLDAARPAPRGGTGACCCSAS